MITTLTHQCVPRYSFTYIWCKSVQHTTVCRRAQYMQHLFGFIVVFTLDYQTIVIYVPILIYIYMLAKCIFGTHTWGSTKWEISSFVSHQWYHEAISVKLTHVFVLIYKHDGWWGFLQSRETCFYTSSSMKANFVYVVGSVTNTAINSGIATLFNYMYIPF